MSGEGASRLASGCLVTINPPPRQGVFLVSLTTRHGLLLFHRGQNLTIPTVYAFDFWATRDFAPSIAFSHLRSQGLGNIYIIYSNLFDLNKGKQATAQGGVPCR